MESGKMDFELHRANTTGVDRTKQSKANTGYAQSLDIRFAFQSSVSDIAVTVDSFPPLAGDEQSALECGQV